MKLSPLFAKYLYQQKQLRLPGIGVFSIDPSITVPDISDKLFPDFLQNIQFKQQTVNAPDEEFINFIRTETGKIKPLAESDLDSFLSDGKILLNIGKPFHIEGIGNIHKTREGVLEFKAGDPNYHKTEIHHDTEETVEKSKPFFLETNKSSSSRKILIAFGIIAGIVIVIWGGYVLYNRNGATGNETTSTTGAETNVPPDTTAISKMPDSFAGSKTDSTSSRSSYKFIIEKTRNKGRALRRFNQLSGNYTPIKMETQDSTEFKLYFQLPAMPADTARIRDSLKIWYGRRIVYVE